MSKTTAGLCLSQEAELLVQMSLSAEQASGELNDEQYKQIEQMLSAAFMYEKDGSTLRLWEDYDWFSSGHPESWLLHKVLGHSEKAYLFIYLGDAYDTTIVEGKHFYNAFHFGLVQEISFDDQGAIRTA